MLPLRMQKNYTQLILGIIIGLIIGLFIGKQIFRTDHASHTSLIQSSSSPAGVAQNEDKSNGISSSGNENNDSIPQKVYVVLNYILEHHHAMDGYVGGRVFTNREKIVPQFDAKGNPITYQEWDVNPKIEGQNRGTERILTGSDGRNWYTDDHYKTFKEIK